MTQKVGWTAGFLLALNLAAFGQTDRPLRVRVDVVPVTVVVTDEQGKPITDLRREDFSVFENGVKQDIKHFQILTPGAARLLPDDRQFTETAGFPGGQHQRSFLILLGRGRYAPVFNDLGDLLVKKLNPGDQVAIVAHGFATPFLSDHARALTVLERCKAHWDTIEKELEQATRSELAVVYGGSPEAQVESLVQEMLGDCRRILPPRPDVGRLERRKADREVIEYEERAIMERRMDETPIPANNRKYREFDRVRSDRLRHGAPSGAFLALRGAAEEDLQNLFASVDYLKAAKGDRHLLFLTTNGLVLPGLLNPEVPGNVACLASDAAVKIHAVHVSEPSEKGQESGSQRTANNPQQQITQKAASGGSASDNRGQGPAPLLYALTDIGSSALGSMKDLSELSGGQSFVNAEVKQAFFAISDATQTLYLLGYTPADQKLDSRYRRIKVEVSARNTRVFSRGGYYARPLPPGVEAQRHYSRTIAALSSPALLDDIRLTIDRLIPSNSAPGAGIQLEMSLKVQPDMFAKSGGHFIGRLSVAYFFLTEGDKLVDQAWDTVEMNLEEGTHRQVLKSGVKLVGKLPVPGDLRKGRVKVVVYSPQADLLGSSVRKWSR